MKKYFFYLQIKQPKHLNEHNKCQQTNLLLNELLYTTNYYYQM